MTFPCVNCGKDYELRTDQDEYSKAISFGVIESRADELNFYTNHGFMICDECYEKLVKHFMEKWNKIRNGGISQNESI